MNAKDKKEIAKIVLEVLKSTQELTQVKPQEKTLSKKKPKEKPQEKKPELPYSDTTKILQDMKLEEIISRFGILWNSKTPYADFKSQAIIKFYNDYNIKAYKRWNLPYACKDLIIDRQVEGKNPNGMINSIEKRIDEINGRLDREMKPTQKMTVNNIAKREEHLIKQLEKLEKRLSDEQDN